MTFLHHTGSALLDELLTKRNRIHAAWQVPRLPRPVMLPRVKIEPEKSLKERVAEAIKLRKTISKSKLYSILNAIHRSSQDMGEVMDTSGLEGPPEIVHPGGITILKIQRVVAEHFNLTMWDITLSKQRDPRILVPRQIAMYLARKLIPKSRGKFGSLDYISIRFGGRDHTTVCHAIKKIERMMMDDAAFAEEVKSLAIAS